MIDQMMEHMPWLTKLNNSAREWVYQLVMFGMTAPQVLNTQTIGTAVVVGILSAFGGAYLTAERTAVELKQYAREQGEFRAEMRTYMRDQAAELRVIYDRQARTEASISAIHGQNGMPGQNGNGRK